MKIAFFSVFPLEYAGGLEKYFIEISTNLKSRFSDDIEVVEIINLNNSFYENLCKLISLSQFYKIKPTYREKTDDIQNKLTNVIWKKINYRNLESEINKFDIVYTKNEILELFLLNLIKTKNVKLISGVHTPPQYPITKSISSRLHNFLYSSFIYKILAKKVNTFHTINSFDENFIKKQFPDKKVVKIYNPFNFDNFKNIADIYKFNFSFDKDKINITWIGRLTKQKGVDDLIKIIKKTNEKYKKLIIWNIVGDGEEKSKIENLLKCFSNINYFGYINQTHIPSILKNSNLFISTSKWEGFPYNILEANSLSLPVIAYNISGVTDIIENQKNGIIVNDIDNFCENIENIINNKNYFKEDIFEYIKNKFDIDKIYNNLFNLFK